VILWQAKFQPFIARETFSNWELYGVEQDKCAFLTVNWPYIGNDDTAMQGYD